MPDLELPPHIAEGFAELPIHGREPLALYLIHGYQPGSFLTAVLENNLAESFGRADEINRHRIFDYVNFLYTYAPSPCWGSPEKVEAWIERGGIRGRVKKAKGDAG